MRPVSICVTAHPTDSSRDLTSPVARSERNTSRASSRTVGKSRPSPSALRSTIVAFSSKFRARFDGIPFEFCRGSG